MKRKFYLFLILMMSGYTINVSAQNKPVTFGIKAGVNLSNASTKLDDESFGLNGKDSKTGFQAGVTIDLKVSETFFFQSGLSFTTKGVVFKEADLISGGGSTAQTKSSEYKTNLLYLQLPFMGAYKVKIATDTRIVISAGPYLAYGVGGKIEPSATYSAIPWGDDEDLNSFGERTFKKFDFGMGTGIGLEYKNYCLNLSYEWGLSNINRDSYNSDIDHLFHREYKNRNASLTLGYKF